MSDFISSGEQYSVLNNGILGKRDRSSYDRLSNELDNRITLFDRGGGINAVFNRRRSYNPSERLILNSHSDDGNRAHDCSDASYVDKLEQLSSTLIQLLSNAIPKSFQVKASDRLSQPSLNQYDLMFHEGSNFRYQHADRQIRQNLTHSDSCKDSDFYEDTLQTNHNVRQLKRLSSTTIGTANRRQYSLQDSSRPVFETLSTPGVFNVNQLLLPDLFTPSKLRTSETYSTDKLTSTARTGGKTLSSHESDSARQNTYKAYDRQKKDIHNKVEKRRRTNINDRITELRTLLPEYIGRTSCQKKSSILKESVDYIKKLKSDLCRLKQLEDKMKEINIEVQKLGFKLKQLELAISPVLADNLDTSQVKYKTTPQELSFSSRATLLPVTRTEILLTRLRWNSDQIFSHRSHKPWLTQQYMYLVAPRKKSMSWIFTYEDILLKRSHAFIRVLYA